MSCPNCERYRKALEEIVNYTEDFSSQITASNALAPTPEERGETPLFEGMPV